MHMEQLKCNTPITSSLAMEINVSERRAVLRVVWGGCVTPPSPHGLKIMNSLDRFEIFSCSLSRQSVDSSDQKCLKPVTMYVLLAFIEATVAGEGHYLLGLQGRCA